jgi:hypothetical protein
MCPARAAITAEATPHAAMSLMIRRARRRDRAAIDSQIGVPVQSGGIEDAIRFVRHVALRLNQRPRKILDFETPADRLLKGVAMAS